MKGAGITALALGWVLLLPPALRGATDLPKHGGVLTMAIRRDLEILNPLVNTRSTDRSVRELMFEPLLGIDLKGNVRPNLAESWEMSREGKIYTFRLRRGVKFHNSQEMTADDVKFAMDYTMNPKNGARGLIFLSVVSKVEVADRYILKVFLKGPSPGFLSSITDIRAFSVIPKGSLPEGLDKPTHFPPGTGPFKFIEWQPQQRVVLERFNEYWGHKAFLDRVVLQPIKDATVRFTALRAGDVDMVEETPYEWVKQVVDRKIKGLSYASAAHKSFLNVEFNVAGTPFNDRRLREAVAHAINRNEILEAAYFGFGDPTDQKYPKGHVWYLDGVPSRSYDVKKAKELLQEAGYRGETIDFLARQGEEMRATVLQAQLKRIGMNIKLEVLDSGAYSGRIRKGDFGFTFGGGSPDPDPSTAYGPDLRCEPDLKKRANNDTGYCDPEVDALLKKAEVETDAAKRRESYRRIATKVYSDLPEIYIAFIPTFFTFRDTVRGFTTDSNGSFLWWDGGLHYAWLDR